MVLVKDVGIEEFRQKLESRLNKKLTDDDIAILYEKEKNYNINIAIERCFYRLQAQKQLELIVIGAFVSKDRKYFVAIDQDVKNFYNLTGAVNEYFLKANPGDKVKVFGNLRNNWIITNEITKIANSFEFTDKICSDNPNDILDSGLLIIPDGFTNFNLPIDWTKWDPEQNPEDWERASIYNDGLVSFTLSVETEDDRITIYFSNVPIAFFSGILTPESCESIEKLEDALLPFIMNGVLAVSVYRRESPQTIVRSDTVKTKHKFNGHSLLLIKKTELKQTIIDIDTKDQIENKKVEQVEQKQEVKTIQEQTIRQEQKKKDQKIGQKQEQKQEFKGITAYQKEVIKTILKEFEESSINLSNKILEDIIKYMRKVEIKNGKVSENDLRTKFSSLQIKKQEDQDALIMSFLRNGLVYSESPGFCKLME
ncbi:MAG: hypothetical protein ACTSRP_07470 [Candidatus Helarchaeota archaeon]